MSFDPAHAPPPVSLRIAVITVSTSRSVAASPAEDRSGQAIADAAVAAGHVIAQRTLVADDPEAIGAALRRALGSVAEAVVLTGGTGLSARDCTPAVVRGVLDVEIPGFGELFRMLSFADVGSKAMLSSALGGVAVGKPVFALPGSTRACTLGMEKLILPELAHILAQLRVEAPLSVAAGAPSSVASGRAGLSERARAAALRSAQGKAAEVLDAPAPVPGPASAGGLTLTAAPDAERMDAAPIASGWEAGVRALHGSLERAQPEIPESLLRLQPVVDVLNAAGTRAVLRLADGQVYGAYGYPDLARRGAKVLLVREAEPLAEIVALHRWPERVGLCAEDGGVLPASELALASFTEDRCGGAYEGPGTLFAVEGGAVWIAHERRVFRWDGKQSEERARASAQPLSMALASLVLQWSGR